VNDVDAFDEPAVDKLTPDEPALQPSAIERLPMNEPPKQGVPGRLAALPLVVPNAENAEPGDALVAALFWPSVVPSCEVPCGTV
jgi:hypothetical protein